MTYTCRHCGVAFIGDRAVHRWTDHTWIHWPETQGQVS